MIMHHHFFLKHGNLSKIIAVLLLSLFLTLLLPLLFVQAKAKTPVIILSHYSKTMNIGDSFYLKALTSDLSFPKFKSSGKSIASVDTYGLVTAKKAGSCRITVSSGSSKSYCQIQVKKTTIQLNETKLSLEHGKSFTLKATTSNGHKATFKCSKKSIALVNENGKITALKPGEAVIKVNADQTEVHCHLTVKKPEISLNHSKVSLYRKQSVKLTAKVSSGIKPVWRTNKKSVALVDDDGNVTAVKHGTAIISASVDGVKKTCTVTVKSPVIKLSKSTVKLQTNNQTRLTAEVSSGISPVWSSSKSSVATVDQNGNIKAKKKGTAIIKVKEDGTTASCTVIVS